MPATVTAAAIPTSPDSFQRYYEEAGPDYAVWSAEFNMHFGFFRWGMNPLNREAMLEQMNLEVLRRLMLADAAPTVLDMGCGLAATLRSFARRVPSANLSGITLVPWQLEQGQVLNHVDPRAEAIRLHLGNYEKTDFASETFAWAEMLIDMTPYRDERRARSDAAFLKREVIFEPRGLIAL